MAGSDDLTLEVNGKALTGWERVSVTRSMEQLPNTFDIVASENSPVAKDAVGVKEGSPCKIKLGSDLVITGYVDTVVSAFGPGGHVVQLVGRGKCADLVDCCAEWKSCQISGTSALDVATKLAAPYGITVTAPAGAGPSIPQFNINLSDRVSDILELITRHAALVYYEGTDGNLILNEVAADDAGSGFEEGKNVQSARVLRSVAERYSDYKCSLLSLDTSGLFEYSDGLFFWQEKDPNVARHRQLVIIAEGVTGDAYQEFMKRRLLWEANRRAGRSRQVSVTVDSWRDGKGKLWTPNSLAKVSLPTLKFTGAVYCISTVTYGFELGRGRTAQVTLMPRETFLPAPIQLLPQIGGVIGPDGKLANATGTGS